MYGNLRPREQRTSRSERIACRPVKADHRTAYGLVVEFDPFHRIETDTLGLADAAADHLDAPVPSCPGWSVGEIVWHVLQVQRFWGTVVAERVQDPGEVAAAVRPADAELVPQLRIGVARLVTALRGAVPDEPVWTWAPRRDAAFVVRHQVQEAAVHRWDAEQAVGIDLPLDAAAATDAIEEFLEFSSPLRVEDATPAGGGLELVATDTGVRWAVQEDPLGAVRWRRLEGGASASPNTVVRATASDLLLFLYRRRPAAALPITGEAAVAERFALRGATD